MCMNLSATTPLELWGGVECTVNRVGDRYGDQMERSGHATRLSDLDLFAGLGLKAMRYPVLWERTAPDSLDTIDWTWADARLDRLRELGVRPIVGLCHHGSGPRHTSLAEAGFAPSLAAYAGKVAERFPWVEAWTPVNEPLTTARFSGLYGHWYPHGATEQLFARCLVNQCRAIVLTMQAVRSINPDAQLIQTDDLGKIYSTPRLRYQADFENERRWLGWDLLCGRVNRHHRMWGHLLWAGIEERELSWFLDNVCPPDIIGINYYLTSERFIDERRERYPVHTYADNGRDGYADVEAVRVLRHGTPGARGMIQEAWERYGLPVAITEAHLGCTREEQMRWLREVWTSAQDAKSGGVDIRAVTAWAMLGSHDWNSLLTRFDGCYETGIYDVRGPRPRPTALAGLVTQLAANISPTHPVLDSPGWWRRPKRLIYPPVEEGSEGTGNREQGTGNAGVASGRATSHEPRATSRAHGPLSGGEGHEPRPVLITGARGTLGYAFARLCDHRNIACAALAHEELDIADVGAVEDALARYKPWAIINAAGFADIDGAQRDMARCERVNVQGAVGLARACQERGLPFLTLSSSQVFDAGKRGAYMESDTPAPVNAYGCSQAKAEAQILAMGSDALIVRAGACFGPWDDRNFLTHDLRELAQGRVVRASGDTAFTPAYVPDLVHACLDLLIDGERGVWHIAHPDGVSHAQLLTLVGEACGLDCGLIQPVTLRSLRLPAPRARVCALASERGQLVQALDAALACYLNDGGRAQVADAMQAEHRRRAEIAAEIMPPVHAERRGNGRAKARV